MASNLMSAIATHVGKMMVFSARFDALPRAISFTVCTGVLASIAILAEQLARGHDIGHTLVVLVCSIVVAALFGLARRDPRVSSGLFLATIPFAAMLALSPFIPGIEFVASVWGGVCLAWLLQPEETPEKAG